MLKGSHFQKPVRTVYQLIHVYGWLSINTHYVFFRMENAFAISMQFAEVTI